MTFAEIERYINSRKRAMELEYKQKAVFDYTLADLIGRSVSRIYNSANKMPTMSEVYPNLFDQVEEAEKIQNKKDELSALRFKQFAQSYNKRHEGSSK